MDYYVEIYQPNGTTKVGTGPINTIISWQQTVRVNRAGEFEFRMLAEDDQASNIVSLNTVKCFAFVRGGYNSSTSTIFNDKFLYIGGGIIQNITTEIDDDGKAVLVVSGQDWLGELSWVSMDRTFFDGTNTDPSTSISVITASQAALIKMSSPQNSWSSSAGASPAYDTLYGRYAYDNVLQAHIKLAELSGAYFVLSDFRTIRWEPSFASTDMRAVQVDGNSDVSPDTVIIRRVTAIKNSQDFATRVIPFGAGNGDSRLTMVPSTIAAPSGYAIVNSSVSGQYKGIRNSTTESTYGIHTHVVQWPEVVPESNTTTAIEKAADQLYYLALDYLKKNEQIISHYDIELTKSLVTVRDGAEVLLRPLHKIRVQYSDPDQLINIDESLNILEATHLLNADGLQTTRILVGTVGRYPATNTEVTVERLSDAETYKVASQVLPNTHTLTFSKPIGRDQTPVTEIRFRLGSDVVQVYSVIFDFYIEKMVSTVDSVTATSNTTGDHTHTNTAHNHTSPSHNHSTAAHAHLENNVLNGPTSSTSPTINSTAVTIDSTAVTITNAGDHSHTITPSVVYDFYQGASSYALSDLEYRLNSAASWTGMQTAASISDNWYRFVLTTNIRNATTLRPNQANNLIEIRRKSGSSANTAQINAQITIQSTVQTIV